MTPSCCSSTHIAIRYLSRCPKSGSAKHGSSNSTLRQATTALMPPRFGPQRRSRWLDMPCRSCAAPTIARTTPELTMGRTTPELTMGRTTPELRLSLAHDRRGDQHEHECAYPHYAVQHD